MLTVDGAERITPKEILSHPFISVTPQRESSAVASQDDDSRLTEPCFRLPLFGGCENARKERWPKLKSRLGRNAVTHERGCAVTFSSVERWILFTQVASFQGCLETKLKMWFLTYKFMPCHIINNDVVQPVRGKYWHRSQIYPPTWSKKLEFSQNFEVQMTWGSQKPTQIIRGQGGGSVF